jgi:hypothetical protein
MEGLPRKSRVWPWKNKFVVETHFIFSTSTSDWRQGPCDFLEAFSSENHGPKWGIFQYAMFDYQRVMDLSDGSFFQYNLDYFFNVS